MWVPYPTFCLHSDVFRIATVTLKFMPTIDQLDTERLLTAAS